MVRRRASHAIRRIKQCAQDGLLLFSDHARREMNDDGFNEADVSSAVRMGRLIARQTLGGRGTRYVLQGPAVDGRKMDAVCRISGDGVRIVTVYRVY
jgi:hypothetical protein